MADHQGYAIHTHHIPVDVFLDIIESNIKKLIHTHGHKDCGLRHEELCKEIKKIIHDSKQIVFQYMDPHSKVKWSKEWDSRRSIYFNKLFDNEGFINMCFPFKNIVHQDLYQLQSRHVNFCKEKDERLSALGKNPPYSECVEYNSWIEKEKASFNPEFLQKVSDYTHRTVKKYFSTKEHPQGHDPRSTYLNSKLNCKQYKSPSKKHQQKSGEKASLDNTHAPRAPNVGKESQEKDGRFAPGVGGGTEKEKSVVKIPFKTEPPASHSQTSSLTKTKVDETANVKHIDLKAKGYDSPNNTQVATGQLTEATDTKGQSSQKLSEYLTPNSPKGSSAATVPNPSSSVIKGQVTESDATPITNSATSDITHSTENAQSPLAPDLSLAQLQPTPVAADTDKYSKEPTPPGPVGKPPDQDAPLIPALDPGLAPSHAATSNSSASKTLSTTMISTPGSSLDQVSHLPTPSTQSIVTTTIATTITQTTTSASNSPATTVSAMSTKPISSIVEITSTTGESGKLNTPLKTITGSQGPNSASPKNKDDPLQPNKGANYPDIPSSPTSGLSSGVSSAGTPPALSASRNIVTKPDDNKIITLPKETSERTKNPTQVTSTSLPKGTQPSDKSIITSTKIPPLSSIIPTIVIMLATITLLFLLYKYTPFGLLLGRRRKRKKRDLRSEFVIPEESTYESPNIVLHEWEDHNLLEQTVKNEEYVKLLKINRYKQEMQKRKKENKKTLIEVHMEVLEEYKSDEWELHKGDFLEICLRGFMNEENNTYSKLPNSELIVNDIKSEKTIEDIQKKEILWNNWIENHRNILEQWKKEEWFHILKNKWRNEEQKYKEKYDKLQKNISNEQDTHSIVSQKEIWKQWISKQATLIKMFNQEDWFKELVDEQNKEKNNYHINEYNNISVTSKIGLKNKKTNHEEGRSKNIIQKLMVQIHMMVLEECIKEDIIRNKESSIDNFIQDIHKQNNYDEKRNIPQCYTHDFSVPEYEEIHISTNK